MKLQNITIVLSLIAATVLLFASYGSAQDAFKLKPGASGRLCLDCHDGLQEKMQQKYVHTPLADGDCTGCHNPHTSTFDKFMDAPADSICYTCHESMVPEGVQSVHQVVVEGKCILCHDPHASDYELNLLRKGSELCFGCHETLAARIKDNQYQHPPVRDDCLACHNAHASDSNASLLDKGSPALCLECHSTDQTTFKKLHRDYPVQKADCTSCHDPHGSNQAAMLYDNLHEPVAKRNCERCHEEPSSSTPFALKADGYETCMACHYEMITETLNRDRIHWPVVDNKGCMNCHTPHASPEENLMRQPMLETCGKCHSDTITRQERATTKHPPIAEGECSACHTPHSSDNKFILNDESLIEVCADCHDWQAHSTHPIGTDYIDPRNRNLTLQCASCHRAHGTEYNHFIYFSTTNELCVQCHVRFRR